MKIYQSEKTSSISNRIVKELNASVLSLTFENLQGEKLADLYNCRNSSNKLVGTGTCPPSGGIFVETVLIRF